MNIDNTYLGTLNRSWRPITGIGMGITVITFPWFLLIYAESDIIGMLVGTYGTLCTTFSALAIIRQVDKNKLIDKDADIQSRVTSNG